MSFAHFVLLYIVKKRKIMVSLSAYRQQMRWMNSMITSTINIMLALVAYFGATKQVRNCFYFCRQWRWHCLSLYRLHTTMRTDMVLARHWVQWITFAHRFHFFFACAVILIFFSLHLYSFFYFHSSQKYCYPLARWIFVSIGC